MQVKGAGELKLVSGPHKLHLYLHVGWKKGFFICVNKLRNDPTMLFFFSLLNIFGSFKSPSYNGKLY